MAFESGCYYKCLPYGPVVELLCDSDFSTLIIVNSVGHTIGVMSTQKTLCVGAHYLPTHKLKHETSIL